MDFGTLFCEICHEALSTTAFSDKNSKICLACEPQLRKCPRCGRYHPPSEFKNDEDKARKNCSKCRIKSAIVTGRRRDRKKAEAALVDNDVSKMCAMCFHVKLVHMFQAFFGGTLHAVCRECETKGKTNKELQRDRSPETVRNYSVAMRARFRERTADYEAYKDLERVRSKKKRKDHPDIVNYSDGALFSSYKKSAKVRNLGFHLTEADVARLCDEPCCYCGQMNDHGRNGIDRVNNSEGYSIENCVGCCSICNYMKTDWSKRSFIAYIGHIVFCYDGTGDACKERVPDATRASFIQYIYGAEKRGYEFRLSVEQYDAITFGDCYLCGKQNSETHSNGIDRVDNDEGYIFDNCKPCCVHCNRLKKGASLTEFFAKCRLIFLKHSVSDTFKDEKFSKQKSGE